MSLIDEQSIQHLAQKEAHIFPFFSADNQVDNEVSKCLITQMKDLFNFCSTISHSLINLF